ncbi:hypothetical protein NC651_037299 [Populus alba x Populus x berolinensis]|nr:hypothetical protein NC651_037299 [Populus alba x Populus x berolinensis]
MKWISWKLISFVHTPQQISVACRNHNQMKWISWKLISLVHILFGQPSRLPLAAQFIKKRCELSFDVKPGGLSAAATII